MIVRIVMKIIKKTMLIILMLPLLASCGGAYSSKFNCPDASGYGCTSIDIIDQRITSGQIEEINAARAKQKCKGRSCRIKKEREMKPELKELTPAEVEFIEN